MAEFLDQIRDKYTIPSPLGRGTSISAEIDFVSSGQVKEPPGLKEGLDGYTMQIEEIRRVRPPALVLTTKIWLDGILLGDTT